MAYQKQLYQSFLWRGLYFVSTFLVNIFIARYFQAALSGIIYYLTSLYAFFLLVAGLSLESGICYYISKKQIPVPALFNLSILWTLAIGLLVFIFFSFAGVKPPPGLPAGLLLLSSLSYICGILASNYFSNIFYGQQNFFLPNLISTSCNILLMVTLLAAGVFPHSGFLRNNLLLFYFLIFLIQGTALGIAVVRTFPGRWKLILPPRDTMRKLLNYSLAAFLSNVVFFLMYRIDYYFVERYCRPEQLGNYVQVSKIGQVLITIPSILGSTVFAITAGGQQDEINDALPLLSRVLIMITCALCAIPVLFGYWLFPLIFGSTFQFMYLPFLLLVPGILALAAGYPMSAYFSGKNLIMVNTKGTLCGLTLIIAGDLLLIPRFGIEAAALVSSLGYLLYYVIVFRIFHHETRVNVAKFFIFRRSDLAWTKNFILKRNAAPNDMES